MFVSEISNFLSIWLSTENMHTSFGYLIYKGKNLRHDHANRGKYLLFKRK